MLADPAARAELSRRAAGLRAEGRSWARIGAALGLPLTTARDLALAGAG
jgi:hypothetical protein